MAKIRISTIEKLEASARTAILDAEKAAQQPKRPPGRPKKDFKQANYDALHPTHVKHPDVNRSAQRIGRLIKAYGPPHEWQVVRKGFSDEGVHTAAGYRVHKYYELHCLSMGTAAHPVHPDVIAGDGEAMKYGHVQLPGRYLHRGRPRARHPQFESWFDENPDVLQAAKNALLPELVSVNPEPLENLDPLPATVIISTEEVLPSFEQQAQAPEPEPEPGNPPELDLDDFLSQEDFTFEELEP